MKETFPRIKKIKIEKISMCLPKLLIVYNFAILVLPSNY
jgi:hypothetical protein